jgi:Periplasmic binding protein-like domain
VAGYGANPFSATMFPALTTVGTPAWKLGNAASELLLDVIGGRARPPAQRVLPWQFEIRQSTVWDPAEWSARSPDGPDGQPDRPIAAADVRSAQ